MVFVAAALLSLKEGNPNARKKLPPVDPYRDIDADRIEWYH